MRKEEDDVIANGQMIEELEQQQQQQQQSGQGQGSLNPSSPAQDSNPLGGSGPGNVDRRNHGEADDWGITSQRTTKAATANQQRIARSLS